MSGMKRRLRGQMKQALWAIDAKDAARRSAHACALLTALPEFRQARTVMVYLHMAHELSVDAAAEAAWADGKTVLAPKFSVRRREMVGVRIDSLTEGLVPGDYGIREPAAWDPWPVGEIDLVVVPGLAFDRRGNRLGRGAGLYDRFLASPQRRALACGAAFAEQLVDRLPAQPHDVPLNLLGTDRQVLRYNHQG
jgi:5-formyltetrahydrofolate cyclo-ligase